MSSAALAFCLVAPLGFHVFVDILGRNHNTIFLVETANWIQLVVDDSAECQRAVRGCWYAQIWYQKVPLDLGERHNEHTERDADESVLG